MHLRLPGFYCNSIPEASFFHGDSETVSSIWVKFNYVKELRAHGTSKRNVLRTKMEAKPNFRADSRVNGGFSIYPLIFIFGNSSSESDIKDEQSKACDHSPERNGSACGALQRWPRAVSSGRGAAEGRRSCCCHCVGC